MGRSISDIAKEITHLDQAHKAGELSDTAHEAAKSALLAEMAAASGAAKTEPAPTAPTKAEPPSKPKPPPKLAPRMMSTTTRHPREGPRTYGLRLRAWLSCLPSGCSASRAYNS